MILTVTCNPAIDVTYRLRDGLRPGEVHRVADVERRPGGKGVNVARVLHQLGVPVHATGLADDTFAARLGALGVPATFLPVMPEVRMTLVVHDGTTTSLWEPGTPVPPDAGDRLVDEVGSRVEGADALVVSGSVPPGLAADVPARLADLARQAGVPAVVDVDDAALRAAAERGGAVLTPNSEELARLVGTVADPATAVRELAARTGAPVVLTRGEDGILMSDGTQCWSARLPRPVAGNPTGAGDATAAGIAHGLATGREWPEILRHAVALGAGAVAAPTAGEVDLASSEAHLPQVRVDAADPDPNGARA